MFWFGSPHKVSYLVHLPHQAICHFYFSIHKLNFNLRFCKMTVDIITILENIFI
jgi:hypothetical protein